MKMSEESSRDAIFDKLRSQDKFLEAFTYAWGIVESDIDSMMIDEFALQYSQNKSMAKLVVKRDYLLKGGFGGKVDFLRDIERITPGESASIKNFAHSRNGLFHDNSYSMRIINISSDEKRKYLDQAAKTLELCLEAITRRRSDLIDLIKSRDLAKKRAHGVILKPRESP